MNVNEITAEINELSEDDVREVLGYCESVLDARETDRGNQE